MVIYEKGIAFDIEYVVAQNPPEDLVELNPYGTTPTLVDRDLVLYDSRIIMEYLDERFPHPPLYPMDPVSRARMRMLMQRIEQDWYTPMEEILRVGEKKASKAKKALKESIISAMPAFGSKQFFLSDELTLVDCTLAPLLWRLPTLGIDLPKQAEGLKLYASRLFERESFQASLSEHESELQAGVNAMLAA